MLEPTWKATPEVVLGILKGLAQAKPRPQTGRPGWETVRDEVLRHPLLRISPLRAAFLELLAEAHCLLQIREDTHFYATLALPILRRTLLESGRHLASVGVLGSSKDVFHLKLANSNGSTGHGHRHRDSPRQLRAVVLRRKERRAMLEGTALIERVSSVEPSLRATRGCTGHRAAPVWRRDPYASSATAQSLGSSARARFWLLHTPTLPGPRSSSGPLRLWWTAAGRHRTRLSWHASTAFQP